MTLQSAVAVLGIIFDPLCFLSGLLKGPWFPLNSAVKVSQLMWAGSRRGSSESPLFVMSKTSADGEQRHRCQEQLPRSID